MYPVGLQFRRWNKVSYFGSISSLIYWCDLVIFLPLLKYIHGSEVPCGHWVRESDSLNVKKGYVPMELILPGFIVC